MTLRNVQITSHSSITYQERSGIYGTATEYMCIDALLLDREGSVRLDFQHPAQTSYCTPLAYPVVR